MMAAPAAVPLEAVEGRPNSNAHPRDSLRMLCREDQGPRRPRPRSHRPRSGEAKALWSGSQGHSREAFPKRRPPRFKKTLKEGCGKVTGQSDLLPLILSSWRGFPALAPCRPFGGRLFHGRRYRGRQKKNPHRRQGFKVERSWELSCFDPKQWASAPSHEVKGNACFRPGPGQRGSLYLNCPSSSGSFPWPTW